MEALDELAVQSSCPRVVAVIPAFNEERFVGSVVITARQYADRVVVVDDGSSDRTALVARAAGAEVIELPENGGKGHALNAGFEWARKLNPRAVVMLDADAQHDAAEIPQLVRPIMAEEADVVIGSRFLETKSDIPRWRQAGQHALTLVTNTASGISTTDSQSGYRAFSPAALQLLRFHSSGLAMESEMQFLLQRSALRVAEVPISVQYLDGNKRNPVLHGLQVLDVILGLVARRRPLMFIGFPGALLTVLGFLVGIFVVDVVNTHHAVPVGTVILSALFMIVGILLSVTGIILNTLEHFMTRLRQEMHDVVVTASSGKVA